MNDAVAYALIAVALGVGTTFMSVFVAARAAKRKAAGEGDGKARP